MISSRSVLFVGLTVALAAGAGIAVRWIPSPHAVSRESSHPEGTRWGRLVTPENAHREYPRPQMRRSEWTNLNGLWDYAITPRGADRPVVFDGAILVPFCVESSLSGVGRSVAASDVVWYRRIVRLPRGPRGHRVLLHFGAVDWQTTVFVGSRKVGEHLGGYDPFSFDITDALLIGDEQEIVVRVWDPTDTGMQPRGKQVIEPGGIWYTAATGIWQTVWAEVVPSSSVDSLTMTPDVNAGAIHVMTAVRGPSTGRRVRVSVAAAGMTVAAVSGLAGTVVTVPIPAPRVWSPESPFLYDVTVELLDGTRVEDRVTSYAGLRSVEVRPGRDGRPRIWLNHASVFQLGVLDQGRWPDGIVTPPSVAAMEDELRTLKALGFNLVRKHAIVAPATFYAACDRLGILVWQDMPSGFDPSHRPGGPRDALVPIDAADAAGFRQEFAAVIDALRHFPSIVAWVPFNEGWGQHDTAAVTRWAMGYDPTRLVDGPSGWVDQGAGQMKDKHAYPGPDMFPAAGGRASVLGEFGGLGLPVADHLWTRVDPWAYRVFETSDDFRSAYRQVIGRLLPLIDRGLSAAIYTQATDVEDEINGVMTYDRDVVKLDVRDARAWHGRVYARAASR